MFRVLCVVLLDERPLGLVRPFSSVMDDSVRKDAVR